MQILTILIIIMISLFPIVIWAYVFSYIDNNPINKKRFLVWIIGWALSVFPILHMDKIIDYFKFDYLNIFYFIRNIWDISSTFQFIISLSIFLIFLVLTSFLLWSFIHKFKQILLIYLKNILVFLILIIWLWILVYLFNKFFSFDFTINQPIWFWKIFFDSFKLIIFYYLLVGFIEEASKHFNFLQSSILYIDSIKTWVLYAIFVALGFALVENILYFYNIYTIKWLWSELVSTYFFRSIFSVMVHVLTSSVVGYYFSKALILYRNQELSFPYLKIFIFWLIISILLHLIFDVALTLWFSFVIILYFLWGYLYVSSIFYRK